MGRRRGQRTGHLRAEHGSWLLTYRVYDQFGRSNRQTVRIGPAEGQGKLTEKQAERFAWDHYLSKVDHAVQRPKSVCTVGEFWDQKFQPQMEIRLKRTTRAQYKSLYATWIKPEIGHLRLGIVSPDDVERIVGAVKKAGKSAWTVSHVRKVVSAIFTRAKRLQYAFGDNPAAYVDLPQEQGVRPIYALTAEQCRGVVEGLPSPYSEMALTAILTSMNVAEMCGLKWSRVNLASEPQLAGAEVIPERTIAVREHFGRFREQGTLKARSRRRDIPMPEELRQALLKWRDSSPFSGPDDPVFAGRTGKPVNEGNVRRRWLQPLAVKLELPALGWHTFRHTHATLTKLAGVSDLYRQVLMGHASIEMTDRYTHGDREAMRDGIGKVAAMIATAAKPEKVIPLKRGQYYSTLASVDDGFEVEMPKTGRAG